MLKTIVQYQVNVTLRYDINDEPMSAEYERARLQATLKETLSDDYPNLEVDIKFVTASKAAKP